MTRKTKRLGEKQERAVSPVIGVVLMVAITVILAAVIAVFVLDVGQSVDRDAQAGVTISVDESADELRVEVTSLGNADYVELGGDVNETGGEVADHDNRLGVGDVLTLTYDGNELEERNGTVTAVAVINETDTRTQVASQGYDFE